MSTLSDPQRTTTFISSTYLTNPNFARLGRLVLDPRDPEAPSCDIFPDQDALFQSSQFEISVSDKINLAGTYNSDKKKSLPEALLNLFSRITPVTNEKRMTLEGEVQRYQFEDPKIVLNRVHEQKDVQQWLEEYVIKAGLTAYMVVGYHTIKSPKIHMDDSKSIDIVAAGLAATVISEASKMSSGVSKVSSESTTSLTSVSSSGSKQSSFHEGSVLWGVRYRKIVCKLSHWGAEVKLKLKENEWTMPWSVRGQDNTIQKLAEAHLGDAAEFEPEPVDSDEEEEEPPEHYFNTSDDSEGAMEEFIFFHDQKHED